MAEHLFVAVGIDLVTDWILEKFGIRSRAVKCAIKVALHILFTWAYLWVPAAA